MAGTGLEPRWASPPGATIASALLERGVSPTDFALQVGLQQADVPRLLSGKLSITVDLARRLADIVGGSTTFWLTRDAQYQEDRTRVVADRWAQKLPIAQMASFGWVERPQTWQERIAVGFDFFGVPDVETWEARYDRQVVSTHYRKSPSFRLEPSATTAWFRAAEREVEARGGIPEFGRDGFARAMSSLRHLTRERDPERFIPKLVSVGAEFGVHIVVVPAPSGCPASGACRMYNDRPLLQLSARFLTDDHFWFTFFHEVGHVANHPLEHGFIDVPEAWEDDMFEQEASGFSMECLLGPDRGELRTERRAWSHRDVVREATALGVAPGVLVGQLQHADVVPRRYLNRLKRRYAWKGSRLVAASD